MLRVILIDDEEDARFILRSLLEKHFPEDISIVAEADSIESGLDAIQKNKVNLVFLDIQLKNGTGFDLLEKIDHKDFEVVFVTAYNQYAIKAFQFSALGYLMKPIKLKELSSLIENLRLHFEKYQKGSDKRLKVLVENFGDDRMIKKLVISNVEGFKVVALEDILRLEGNGNYTNFITMAADMKKYTASKTLGEYESLLSEFGFFRIHQSTIINLRHVTGYQKGDGGWAEMTDGKKLQISRYRKNDFMKKFL